jgi:hypothetical protein
MVRRHLIRMVLAAFAWAGVQSAPADQIQFTGNAAVDLPWQTGNGIIVDNPFPRPAGVSGEPVSNPNDVAQAAWMTQQGWVSGFNIKDVRIHYDKASDSLAVAVNFFGIAGDIDGNGYPGIADPRTIAAGGIKLPHLGGRASVTIGLNLHAGDASHVGTPDIVAGVPADKSQAGPGIDGFTVATYRPSNEGIQFNYGPTLYDHLGKLAFDPDKAHPSFEFTITNMSKFPGFDPLTNNLGIKVFAGSPDDVVGGEDTIPWTTLAPEQFVPEPAALLAWSLGAAAAFAWARYRRSVRA